MIDGGHIPMFTHCDCFQIQAESLKEQVNRQSKKEDELREQLHKQVETYSNRIKELENRLQALDNENLELKGKFESVRFFGHRE